MSCSESSPVFDATLLMSKTYISAKPDSGIPWREEPIPEREALDRMFTNARKAIEEHHQAVCIRPFDAMPYVKTLDITKEKLTEEESTPLTLSPQFTEKQGLRPRMEDAHFYTELEKGTLVGVFDGHGGPEVAQFANEAFQKRFPDALKNAKENVHQAFETVIDQIHQEVARHYEWNRIGSTAVVSYIDHATHQIYTVTLGDSEANIYRKVEEEMRSIPLSAVRDWLSKKDLQRLVSNYGFQVYSLGRLCNYNSKYIRSRLREGVNLSRAIGDVSERGSSIPLVIHKPKITVNKLKHGDILILACDGLKDFVLEAQIVKMIAEYTLGTKKDGLSSILVEKALSQMNETENDNVTVGVIHVS